MKVSKEGILVSGEGEVSCWNRNSNVDSYHSSISLHGEASCIVSALGEDCRTVSEGVCIHDSDTLFIVLYSLDTSNRSKDFAVTDAHILSNMVEDGWTYEESVL